jgi:hypothetical protein
MPDGEKETLAGWGPMLRLRRNLEFSGATAWYLDAA